jgi:hypothetical protein
MTNALMVNEGIQLEIFSHEAIQEITATSLIVKENTEIEPWLQLMAGLFGLRLRVKQIGERETIWSIADALNHGEEHWSEEYSQALDPNSSSPKTAGNWMRVTKKFIPSRRREKLSFSHHAAVYNLPELDQDKMLDEAEQEGYSVGQLRKRVREQYPTEKSANAAAKRKERGINDEEAPIAMDHVTAMSQLRDVLFFLETSDAGEPVADWPENIREDYKGVLVGYKKFSSKLNKG